MHVTGVLGRQADAFLIDQRCGAPNSNRTSLPALIITGFAGGSNRPSRT